MAQNKSTKKKEKKKRKKKATSTINYLIYSDDEKLSLQNGGYNLHASWHL